MSDVSSAGAGIGFFGFALLAGGWLWWNGDIAAQWSLFSVQPGDMSAKKTLALSHSEHRSLGDCRVEASIRRVHGGTDGTLATHVFFCGLACEAKVEFPDGSATYDATRCRRLEPAVAR